MAEAFFNKLAGGKATALSAGSEPADKVNPAAAEVMLELGIDIRSNKPKKLTEEMLEGIDLAITMGCEQACPYTGAETRDWALEDPKDKPIETVRRIRDEINIKVEALLDEISPTIRQEYKGTIQMDKQEEIKIVAYHLWEGDSRGHGHDLEHWLKAETICAEKHEAEIKVPSPSEISQETSRKRGRKAVKKKA
jgi:protein-tyrosine-phosphatase